MRKRTGLLVVAASIIVGCVYPASAGHLSQYTATTGLTATSAQDSVLLVWESYPSSNDRVQIDHAVAYAGAVGALNVCVGGALRLDHQQGDYPAGYTQAREIHIFREDNGSGTFNQIFAATPTATSYTDEGLAAGTYVYKIRAKCNVPAVPMITRPIPIT